MSLKSDLCSVEVTASQPPTTGSGEDNNGGGGQKNTFLRKRVRSKSLSITSFSGLNDVFFNEVVYKVLGQEISQSSEVLVPGKPAWSYPRDIKLTDFLDKALTSEQKRKLYDFGRQLREGNYLAEKTYINLNIFVPLDEKDVLDFSVSSGRGEPDKLISTFRTEPVYNFYQKDYEKKIEGVGEKQIPSIHMYNFLFESLYDRDQSSYDEQYLEYFKYGNKLETDPFKNKIKNFPFSRYLTDVYNQLDIRKTPPKQTQSSSVFATTLDDIEEYTRMSEASKVVSPMGIYIDFPFNAGLRLDDSNREKETIKKTFRLTNTDLNLYSLWTSEVEDNSTGFGIYIKRISLNVRENFPSSVDNEVFRKETEKKEYLSADMSTFFSNFKKVDKSAIDPANNDRLTIIGQTNEQYQKYKNGPVYNFFTDLMTSIADAAFQRLSKKYTPTLDDIRSFKKTPYEVLFYKILKKDANNKIIQEYVLPNPIEDDPEFKNAQDKLIKFFDSQVKYDTEYIYEVYSYALVFGAKYYFMPTNTWWQILNATTDGKPFDLHGFYPVIEPYTPIIEVPLFTTRGRVLDNPPIFPSVYFNSFKGKNNQVLLKIKNTNNSSKEKPILFKEEETQMIEKLLQNKEYDKDGRVLYKNDDLIRHYEVYRTTERPSSYLDMSSNLLQKLEVKGYDGYNFLDKVRPNIDYYYCVRALDVHGNFSNPTPVFRFRLNDEQGYLYQEVEQIDFVDTSYFEYSKSMHKYIRIKPSLQNIDFNEENLQSRKTAKTYPNSENLFGTAEKACWGKNFKLRITSKTSGKKVDINFKFNKKKINPPESIKVLDLPFFEEPSEGVIGNDPLDILVSEGG